MRTRASIDSITRWASRIRYWSASLASSPSARRSSSRAGDHAVDRDDVAGTDQDHIAHRHPLDGNFLERGPGPAVRDPRRAVDAHARPRRYTNQ